MLSAYYSDEFLAVPQLIRFDYPAGGDGREPTVLIKGSTLLIKYIALGARMQLAFTSCDGRLRYALRVLDGDSDGGIYGRSLSAKKNWMHRTLEGHEPDDVRGTSQPTFHRDKLRAGSPAMCRRVTAMGTDYSR